MKITLQMQKLIDQSTLNGYTVEVSLGSVDIFKATKKGRITRGVRLYPDGSKYRLDVALDSCTDLRTYANVREILGIAA